jgi:hypothetical protein
MPTGYNSSFIIDDNEAPDTAGAFAGGGLSQHDHRKGELAR